MQRKHAGEICRTTMLCVDSYEQGVPTGRLYNPGCGRTCVFHSLTQLLAEMERLLEDMAFPQSFTAVRSFSHREDDPRTPRHGEKLSPGKLATFSVRILFRQNASWQGSVKWMEGGMEESFRSALELIFLLDSVLSGAAAEKVV